MKADCIFCVINFLGISSGLFSLMMSSYSLAWNIGKPWQWQEILTVVCIATTVVCTAIKDSLRNHKCVLDSQEPQDEINQT